MTVPPKRERLAEFFRRLSALRRASSMDEARKQLNNTLTAVEDEMTGLPNSPDTLGSDGRMYPPLDDNLRKVPGHADVIRLRSRQHNTYIRANGAIEIQAVSDKQVAFEKAGADGRKVWDP